MSIAKKVIAVLMLLGSLAGGFQYMEVRTEKANSDGFREGFIAGYLSGGEGTCNELRRKISNLRWNGERCILD